MFYYCKRHFNVFMTISLVVYCLSCLYVSLSVEEISQEPPTSVHWLRNKDNVLAVGRENGSLTLYDVRNVQLPTCTLSVHERTVARLSSSADG